MSNMPQDAIPSPKPIFRYQVFSCEDLLGMPPVEWRVKGVFPKIGLAVIYGPSRVGKSFLALDLAFAVTRGEDWFDWKTMSCPVLYVYLEAFEGLSARIKAWQEENALPFPDNLHFIREALDLRNKEQVKGIIQAAQSNNCKMVIIDTFSRSTPGIDENSSKDMGIVIQAATAIQQTLDGLVIFVAHPGKEASRDIRGHSSLFAALDAAIKISGKEASGRCLELDKVKEAEGGTKIDFMLKPVLIGIDEDGEPVTSCVVVPLGMRQKDTSKALAKGHCKVLASLCALAQQKTGDISVDAWQKHYYAAHPDKTNATNRQAFHRAKKRLLEEGKITISGNYVTICDTPL